MKTSTRPTANQRNAATHTARYEALRHDVVDCHTPVARHGLAVLMRQGVAAWMHAWSTLPAAEPRSVNDTPRPCALPEGASIEMVRVLAAMTLGHIEQVQP